MSYSRLQTNALAKFADTGMRSGGRAGGAAKDMRGMETYKKQINRY